MPNLNSITLMINAYMAAGNFKSNRYQTGKYFGICDPIETITEERRVKNYNFIDNNGEALPVVFDDRYPFVVFHKVMDLDYKTADVEYGDSGETMEETAMMKLIFFGSRIRMQVRPENVIAAIAMDFPKEFTATEIQNLNINSLIVEMGSVDDDPYRIWAENFEGQDYPHDTDTIGLSISYRLISTYNKCCFSIC